MKYLKIDGTYFRFLEEKFPDIKYVPGEELHLETIKKRIFLRCWNNTQKYKDVKAVAQALGLSVTTTYKLARDYQLLSRSRLKYEENKQTFSECSR